MLLLKSRGSVLSLDILHIQTTKYSEGLDIFVKIIKMLVVTKSLKK